MALSFDAYVLQLQQSRVISYVDVASLCIWAYDYMLTLSLEISVIWTAPWNVPKVLFLLTRYNPIIDSTAAMYYFFHPGISETTCRIMYGIITWMFVVGTGCAEIILMIRTWAVWERDRRLAIALPIFFVLIWCAICISATRYLSSLEFVPIPQPFPPSCFISKRSSIRFVEWVLVMGFEACILLLMSVKAYQTVRNGPISGLVRLVHVDGILYYIVLFGLAVANMVVLLTLPEEYGNLLAFLQPIMHSVLTGRMLLQLRGYERRNIHGDGVTEFLGVCTPIQFMRNNIATSDNAPEDL
ncbi:hypothetical protein PILCRDRAFT_826071 [Piloderma croceum F 1598]|uniref:DUF6533 domain-containing protein n=1 Tax=Piloderma croceum (strain F 1598) TaxID=765440 RepID=A0A0C3BH56_PILCF|nr:hypothetical protein PILCRDRAFT_826071 [Piloderma croceum F 1598]